MKRSTTPEMRTLPEIKLNSFGITSKRKRFWSAMEHVCSSYADHTQVHGFFYLRASERTVFKSIFWSMFIITSFLFGGGILHRLIAQFFDVPFTITKENPEHLVNIPFPSVSLCHPQTVIHFKALQFVDEIKIPDGLNKTDVLLMLPTALGIFTENQWGSIDNNYLAAIHEILELNGLSVLDAVRAVGIKCPEFIMKCSFNKKRFPCFQNDEYFTFRETMSHIGVCCSFNYNPHNLSYQPMKVNSFGVRGGLSLIGTSFPHVNDGTSGLLFSDGFFLLMHPPYDFPTEASNMALLEVGKITSIGIYPTISTISLDVKALPLKTRKCLIGSDVDLSIYRRPTCTIKCLRRFTYDKCDCHPYFLPIDDHSQQRNCTVLDGECFLKIFYEMKTIRCSYCLPACEDIFYDMSSSTLSYSFANTSVNPMYDQTNVSKSEFTAHIYFAGSTVPVTKMIISQSFLQLLSNFGGVFNLVLGTSVISILELVYYFCIKLPQYMKRHNRIRPVIKTIKPVKSIFSK